MSGIRHQKSERGKPHYAQALRALYPTSALRPLIFAERGPESFRGLCRAVALCEGGFTLLELLIVIGLIAILLVLIVPAFTTIKSGTEVTTAIYGVKGLLENFTTIKSGTEVTTAIYGVKGLLENARAYAKANHTYVFVGFAEVDSSIGSLGQSADYDWRYTLRQSGGGRGCIERWHFTIPIRYHRPGQRLDSELCQWCSSDRGREITNIRESAFCPG